MKNIWFFYVFLLHFQIYFCGLVHFLLIDWCLTPTLAVIQLYRGVSKFLLLTWTLHFLEVMYRYRLINV
jgi:hypothetical protein